VKEISFENIEDVIESYENKNVENIETRNNCIKTIVAQNHE